MNSKPLAVVTGASSGIGSVYADRLAARGYDLVLVARRIDRLRELAEAVHQAHGVHVETVEGDLTTEAGLVTVEDILSTNDRVTMLVNNAGNGTFSKTVDMSNEDSATAIALNVVAPTRLTRALLPALLARAMGAIINISSVMALNVRPTSSLYSATKSYLLTFTRGLQAELADSEIRIQAVLPAGTATEFANARVERTNFDSAVVMTKERLVDAALAGFDLGELVTIPSLHDENLWSVYEDARFSLFAATQKGTPATRYSAIA